MSIGDTPGRIDLQVNGYAGIDFNAAELTGEEMRTACGLLKQDGVAGILATIITAPLEAMVQRISRLARWIDEDPEIASMVWGIHVEGPFISHRAGFVGAHPPDAVVPATPEHTARLLDAGQGRVKLLTLAPEADEDCRVTKQLADQGVIVAAGHSDASLDQLRRAIDSGLRLFTHLGNGCPAMMHRHDNIIQRVLSLADSLCISFIADGHHVPTFALKNFLAVVPEDNIIIVSDAISAARLGPGEYRLSGQTIFVDDAGASWSADRMNFAGSASTLIQMHEVLSGMGFEASRIDCWMRDNPRRLLEGG